MEPADVIVLPRHRSEPDEVELANIEAAIELVVRGVAQRVRLAGLAAADGLASTALARAQAADVAFAIDRDAASVTLTFGPKQTPS